jgi:hypothetical protein
MSIRWDFRPPGAAAPRIPVQPWYVPKHHTKVQPAFIRLLGACTSVWMHWDPTNYNRSTPCHTENCPFCNARSFRFAFAPALLWRRNTGNNQEGWATIIAGFPDQIMDSIGYGNGRGYLLSLWREKLRSGSKICWEVMDTEVKEQLDPAFDVTRPLERIWSFQERQRELAKKQTEQAWRDDLGELVDASAPPAAPPKPTAPLPPPMPNGAPPRPPRPTKPAARTNAAEIREIMARSNVIPFRRPVEASVEPATAAEVPEAPPAAKRARRGRKGGA